MGSLLYSLNHDILFGVIQYLDGNDLSAVAETCTQLSRLCRGAYGPLAPYIPNIQSAHLVTGSFSAGSIASFSGAYSPSSEFADYDSLASTDTEMTSSGEEECQLTITSEVEQRLSSLPSRNHGATLPTLPRELQLEIYSYLDNIDACCLGLTSPNLYVVFRAIHGTKMPLNTRRIGPNRLESAWEVVGKQECKQCGIYRCELHQHIQSWMPKELEYCAFKQNFGLRATSETYTTCCRGKPSKPKRCGRHPLRTTSVHQDDASFNL